MPNPLITALLARNPSHPLVMALLASEGNNIQDALEDIKRPKRKPVSPRKKQQEAARKLAEVEYQMALAPQMEGDFLAKLGLATPGATVESEPFRREQDVKYGGTFGTYTPSEDTVWYSAGFGPGVPAHEYRHRGFHVLEETGNKPSGGFFSEEHLMQEEDLRHPDLFVRDISGSGPQTLRGNVLDKFQQAALEQYRKLSPSLAQTYPEAYKPSILDLLRQIQHGKQWMPGRGYRE